MSPFFQATTKDCLTPCLLLVSSCPACRTPQRLGQREVVRGLTDRTSVGVMSSHFDLCCCEGALEFGGSFFNVWACLAFRFGLVQDNTPCSCPQSCSHGWFRAAHGGASSSHVVPLADIHQSYRYLLTTSNQCPRFVRFLVGSLTWFLEALLRLQGAL